MKKGTKRALTKGERTRSMSKQMEEKLENQISDSDEIHDALNFVSEEEMEMVKKTDSTSGDFTVFESGHK